MGLSKGYKELTEKDRRAALAACVAYREDGEIPRGSFVKIGTKLGLPAQSVARLWKSAESTRLDPSGTIHSPDVKISKGHREGHLLYDREMLKEAILPCVTLAGAVSYVLTRLQENARKLGTQETEFGRSD